MFETVYEKAANEYFAAEKADEWAWRNYVEGTLSEDAYDEIHAIKRARFDQWMSALSAL
jgi:hypothetical protein